MTVSIVFVNILIVCGEIMENRVYISMLLDLYGGLLTEKQYQLMSMYYNEDFSLSEIAELTSTTRQAIHDLLKRCQKLLTQYEEKLKLFEKSTKKNLLIDEILKDLKFILKENDCKVAKLKLENLVNLIDSYNN